METNNKCYMCESKATTREHVPPLCLFPKQKDTNGIDFRKELITVPSCDEHNSKKSKDDEFLMVSIAGIVGNNKIGFFHTKTKVNRAIRRKSKDFLNSAVIKNYKNLVIETKKGGKFPVLYGNPDYKRLVKCFESIAFGLYFNEYKKTFKGKIKILLGFINYNDSNNNTLISLIKEKFKVEELALEVKGENPEVFKYQFCKPDKFGLIGLKLTFYGATDVYISFLPADSNPPFDLGMELIKKGIPTTITINENEFEFNKNNNR